VLPTRYPVIYLTLLSLHSALERYLGNNDARSSPRYIANIEKNLNTNKAKLIVDDAGKVILLLFGVQQFVALFYI